MTPGSGAAAVRVAGGRDEVAVREVLAAAYAGYADVLPPVVFARYTDTVLDPSDAIAGGDQLVAELSGRVLGTVTYCPPSAVDDRGLPPGWASLRGVAVHPDARGSGVGRLLTAACCERAIAAGAEVVGLHTAPFMTAARAIYGGMGFEPDPRYDFDAARYVGVDGIGPLRVQAYRLRVAQPGAGSTR